MILRRPRLWSITRSSGARTFTRRGFVGPPGSGSGGGGGSLGGIEIPIDILTPIVETIILRGFVSVSGTLTDFRNASVDAGTATVSITVDGVPLAGFPVTLSTTPQDLTFSAPVAVGSVVRFVVSAVSGAGAIRGTVLGVNSVVSNGFELTTTIPSVTARTVSLRGYASKAGTLTAMKNAFCSSSPASVSLTINGVAVPGFPSVLNSTPQNVSLNTSYPIGAEFLLTMGSVASPSSMSLTLLGLNT